MRPQRAKFHSLCNVVPPYVLNLVEVYFNKNAVVSCLKIANTLLLGIMLLREENVGA